MHKPASKHCITSESVKEKQTLLCLTVQYLTEDNRFFFILFKMKKFFTSFDSFVSSSFETVDKASGRVVKSFKRTVHLLCTC